MRTRRATALAAMFLLAGIGAVDAADPEDVRWSGGSFDGWDRNVMTNSARLGEVNVTLSSGTDQLFDFTAAYGTLATLTITATDPAGTITNGGTIRLAVPAAWACLFDTGAGVTLGGGASVKVGVASYTDGGRTLSIPVANDFQAGDTLTVDGLRLVDLRLVSPDTRSLALDSNGDGTPDVYDDYSLTVRALWPGGPYDGWDRYAMAEPMALKAAYGTVIRMR